MKQLAVLLLALSGFACVSAVQAPSVSKEIRNRIDAVPSPQLRAHVRCGETVLHREYEAAMDLLSRSPWFASLDARPHEANILLTIRSVQQTPHWNRPSHNFGLAVLSLVVPIGFEELSGFEFEASLPGSKDRLRIDTRREWTSYAWSLASLMNLFPGRAYSPSKKRELDHVHAQLLPLVEGMR